MKTHEAKLKEALRDKIESFVDSQCESAEWSKTEVIVPETLVSHMTDSAWSVFMSIIDAQDYAKSNGYLK